MEADLRALGEKYPGHVFTLDGKNLLCDGRVITIINPIVSAEKIVENGMTEQMFFDRIVEFGVHMLEDSHYYDYDVVQKRKKQCSEQQ
jgi:hypothetical protein